MFLLLFVALSSVSAQNYGYLGGLNTNGASVAGYSNGYQLGGGGPNGGGNGGNTNGNGLSGGGYLSGISVGTPAVAYSSPVQVIPTATSSQSRQDIINPGSIVQQTVSQIPVVTTQVRSVAVPLAYNNYGASNGNGNGGSLGSSYGSAGGYYGAGTSAAAIGAAGSGAGAGNGGNSNGGYGY